MVVWLIFCSVIELSVYCIADYYGSNIFGFELIKCIIYIIFLLSATKIIHSKAYSSEAKAAVNIGTCSLVTSISGICSLIHILYLEEMEEWIVLLGAYLASSMLLIIWLVKIVTKKANSEEKNVKNTDVLGISSIAIGSAIIFGQRAPAEQVIKAASIVLIIFIWLLLVIGFGCLVKMWQLNSIDKQLENKSD